MNELTKYFVIQNIQHIRNKTEALVLLKKHNKYDTYVIFRLAWFIISQFNA